MAAVLEEVVRVDGDNTGLKYLGQSFKIEVIRPNLSSKIYLVGLCHVCKDGVHHWHEHPVLVRMSGVLDDWDNIGALLGHINEIAA